MGGWGRAGRRSPPPSASHEQWLLTSSGRSGVTVGPALRACRPLPTCRQWPTCPPLPTSWHLPTCWHLPARRLPPGGCHLQEVRKVGRNLREVVRLPKTELLVGLLKAVEVHRLDFTALMREPKM